MKKAVIYIRVSTEEQVKHGYSIDAQVKTCANFAQQLGFEVDKTFIEEGLSSKNLNRPQLQELVKYCKRNKRCIDALVFWKWDRLSRGKVKDYGYLDDFFEECNIYPYSVTECNEDTPEGELLRWITKGTNRYELQKISQRTKFGMREKAEQGQLPAKAPLGV
jgi:site-specific DNA recombinase